MTGLEKRGPLLRLVDANAVCTKPLARRTLTRGVAARVVVFDIDCGSQEVPVTHLRKMMLEELQRRNYAQSTVVAYIRALRDFGRYFSKPPDQLGPEHIRKFQLHLLRDRKLAANTVKQRMAAVQFFFMRTLKRAYLREDFHLSENTAALARDSQPRRSDPAHRLSQ